MESLDDGRHRIHYISTREGLTPFVVGLLKGLAMHFDTDIDLHSVDPQQVTSGTHTIFLATVGSDGG